MSHPRIEEVSDSEDVASDPSEGDIDDFNEADILMRKGSAASRSSSQAPIPSQTGGGAPQHILKPEEMQKIMMQQQAAASTGGAIKQQQQADMSKYCDYQHLYPVYFDAARSRAQGRRVSRSLAVENPLAREIVNACARLQLDTLFEPGKTHPKDWANPGRVRVGLKDSPLWQEEDKSKVRGEGIKNKHHLYVLIAQHLQENPTTESCPSLRNVRVGGIPVPDIGVKEEGENGKKKGWPRAQMPRGKGWKAGELLPHWSPALTGGGVSDNLLRDMMKEMGGQGGGGGGIPGMTPGMGGGLGGGAMGDMGGMAQMLQGLQGLAGPGGGMGIGGGSDTGSDAGGVKKKNKKKKK